MIRIALVLTTAFGLAACNTVAGAGKDLSKAGTSITTTAKKTEQSM